MSIRFGWTRPQAGAQTTDDDQVEDVSSVPSHFAAPSDPATAGSADARGDAGAPSDDDVPGGRGPGGQGRPLPVPAGPTPTGNAVTPPNPEAVQAIWDLHARVLESEKKTHRRIGAAAARRVYHEALVEEASALSDLGFETFAAFAAMHGADATSAPAGVVASAASPTPAAPLAASTTTETADEPETAGETLGRIRVLLNELGIEPGVDPLQAAKQFLDVVEGPEAANAEDATEPVMSEHASAQSAVNEFLPPPPPPVVPMTIDIPTPSDTLIPGAKTNAPVPPTPAPPLPAEPERRRERTAAEWSRRAAQAARAAEPVWAARARWPSRPGSACRRASGCRSSSVRPAAGAAA